MGWNHQLEYNHVANLVLSFLFYLGRNSASTIGDSGIITPSKVGSVKLHPTNLEDHPQLVL